MTGEFNITKDLLRQYEPCSNVYKWFCEHYPNGGKYQEILDKLCDNNRFHDACWLLDKIGATTDVLEIDVLEAPNKNLCFSGSIIVKGCIISGSIRTGGSIESDGIIRSEGFIESGGNIKTGWSICAYGWITAIGKIESGMCLTAGRYIKAGKDIKTGGFIEVDEFVESGGYIDANLDIQVGKYVKARGKIQTGEDCGIYAGLYVRVSAQKEYGYITADSKPDNIMCGYWKAK